MPPSDAVGQPPRVSIDLAPNHKQGLLVHTPILLGAGAIGCGDALPRCLDLGLVGAAVIGPVTLKSRAGASTQRVAETFGGLVLETGLQNRGVEATLRRCAPHWPRLGCPVVVQLADHQPDALSAAAERLADQENVAGVELLLPRNADAEMARRVVAALVRVVDVPVWVKVVLERAVEQAQSAVAAGAVGVVVGQAPLGAGFAGATLVSGALLGPVAFAPMLKALVDVKRLNLPCALIASGGLHTRPQVQQALAVGAQAVQIDSALWVEPGILAALQE